MKPSIPAQDLVAALSFAEALVARRCSGDELQQFAFDSAVDGLLAAAARWSPANGPFEPLAKDYIARAVKWATAKHARQRELRPASVPIIEDPVVPAEENLVEFLDLVEQMPGMLRSMVVLHCVLGYTITDAGLLCGIGEKAARVRLARAAARLARAAA